MTTHETEGDDSSSWPPASLVAAFRARKHLHWDKLGVVLTGERWRAGGDLHAVAVWSARVGLWIAGIWLVAVTLAYYWHGHIGGDAHAYWATTHRASSLYAIVYGPDRYLYSPAFAQLVAPLTHLSWPVFAAIWIGAETAAFAWLLRPLGWSLALPALLWCVPELAIGNVLGFVGVALVLSITRPWAWPMMLLTKPTFGVAMLWHAARREWRRLGVALAVTAVIAGASFCVAPNLWWQWLHFLTAMSTGAGHTGGTLWLRLPLAAALSIYAGRTNRPWLLPAAMLIATPAFAGSPSLTVLAAIPRLRVRGYGEPVESMSVNHKLLNTPSRESGSPVGRVV